MIIIIQLEIREILKKIIIDIKEPMQIVNQLNKINKNKKG